MTHNLTMPGNFPQRIHQALKSWSGHLSDEHLDDLYLTRQIKAEKAGVMARLVCNQILLDGLEQLEQLDAAAGHLLEQRFINEETVQTVAFRRNQSDNMVYIQQRQAIVTLANIIWAQEIALRQQHIARIDARLEPPNHSRLFGVAGKLAEIEAKLKAPQGQWLITLEGLGGIGKTSLAVTVVRQLAWTNHFAEMGWVTARRQLFRPSGHFHSCDHYQQLTIAELGECLIDQFNLTALKRESIEQQHIGLTQFFKETPCLVVVDNLDTAEDAYRLAQQLRSWVKPSKFLITTRKHIRDIDGLYPITITELSQSDIADLIQYEGRMKGIHLISQLTQADIDQVYQLTGGNPLAAKLLVAQLETLTITDILQHFKSQQGTAVEALLSYIYDQAWHVLSKSARATFLAMVLTPQEGATLAQIAATAEKSEAETIMNLQTLIQYSLVNVQGDLREKRYSIHQLTHAFLTQKLAQAHV